MGYCIFHQYCTKSTDNGNCSVFVSPARFARGVSRCDNIAIDGLPEDKFFKKEDKGKINPLKASKRAATGAATK